MMEDIQFGSLYPKRFLFGENEQVSVACHEGFRINGERNLTCKSNGFFDHSFPRCAGMNKR